MPALQERFWHWQTEQAEPDFVDRWRTPERTRALIITYFTALSLGLGLEIAALWSLHLIWPAIAGLFISMMAWTMLRNTIYMKDIAPRSELDDYEQHVLDLWRGRALGITRVLLFAGATAMIVVGVSFNALIPTSVFAVVAGLFLLFIYLAVTTLPAVGFALSFNRLIEEV